MIDEEVLERMERYGGSFAKKLAERYRRADRFNKANIERWFWNYFEEYKNWPQEVEK